MCNNCGFSPCNCTNPNYSYNWYNTLNYPCNPCNTTEVCAKKIPAKCTIYKGAILANLNLDTNSDLETIVSVVDTLIGSLLTSSDVQSATNTNILTVLNDINSRLNTLAGGTPHAPYTI